MSFPATNGGSVHSYANLPEDNLSRMRYVNFKKMVILVVYAYTCKYIYIERERYRYDMYLYMVLR